MKTTTLPETDGRLAENVVHFCRALRKANVKVSTAQLETAIRAIAITGFTNKTDFYNVLKSTLISNAEDLEVFKQLFSMFWRNPESLTKMVLQLAPASEVPEQTAPAQRRASQALGSDLKIQSGVSQQLKDATSTMSAQDVVRQKDFAQMTTDELTEAQRIIQTLDFNAPELVSRRTRPARFGRVYDPASTLRTAVRQMGELQRIERKSVRPKKPGLVVLCDISGSMSLYSRMFMRFAHALNHAHPQQWSSVSVFTFGTRLTNVTRAVRHHDTDIALSRVGLEANDWEGGTLIGPTIKTFNQLWARRVLGRGAVLLLITDGLERGDTTLLSAEMQRLHLFCRKLVWLNPLLRWDGFSPKASGIKAMLPHVDSFHACHSLASLTDLANVLQKPR